MTTMIVDPPRKTSLGVGFDANRGRAGNRDAWKQQIGNRPVPARLALLPEPKSNWNKVGFSAIVQLSVLTFFILVPLLYPEGMKTAVHYYTSTPLTTPQTEIPVATPPPPPKPKAVAPKVEVKQDPVEPVKLNPQQPHIFANLAPKTVQPKVEKLEVKAPDMSPKFEATNIEIKENGPKRPKEPPKVGDFGNSGSAATPTIKAAPVDKVQTGGFGDPNGMPGKGDPNHATNVNRLGSPALPGGEGYGNGTGGKEGLRGVVPSTGFGNGTAIPPTSAPKKSAVVAGNFGNATDMTAEAPKKKAGSTGPADTPPDILAKPQPEYTAEGRTMKIEGDVVIDLVFLANGTIQINRVVSGLGHGLDESAVRAAQQIKFKPAKRNGESVDFPARVRIEFRLAY